MFEKDDRRRISRELIVKIERVLARLDEAFRPEDMNLPGFGLHPLKGDLAGYWTVKVSGNWCIIFRFKGRNAWDVNLIDYH